MNAIANITATKLHSLSAPACRAAGTAPGNVTTPRMPYTEPRARKATRAPSASMSQPTRFPARRTIRAPSVA